ncbi:MAG: hypothetical protein JXB03_03250 [Spirochaetales bacterium]|nr:hypothetical protein [Spirochaetales bacterium]
MKKNRIAVFPFALVPLFLLCFFPGCQGGIRDVHTRFGVSYLVDGTVDGCEIHYTESSGDTVILEEVPLPWTLDIYVPDQGISRVMVTAEADEALVFTPFLTGTATSYVNQGLRDDQASFTAAVREGDSVFLADSDYPYAVVKEVVSATELALTRDLFTAGNEPYRIHREQNLTVSVTVDDQTPSTQSVSDLFYLSAFAVGLLR